MGHTRRKSAWMHSFLLSPSHVSRQHTSMTMMHRRSSASSTTTASPATSRSTSSLITRPWQVTTTSTICGCRQQWVCSARSIATLVSLTWAGTRTSFRRTQGRLCSACRLSSSRGASHPEATTSIASSGERADIEDMFIAHIGGMDTLARGLKGAAKLIQEGIQASIVKQRYLSWDENPLAGKVQAGEATLEEMEAYARTKACPWKAPQSSKQEQMETLINRYI